MFVRGWHWVFVWGTSHAEQVGESIVLESGWRGLYSGVGAYMMMWGIFSPLMVRSRCSLWGSPFRHFKHQC